MMPKGQKRGEATFTKSEHRLPGMLTSCEEAQRGGCEKENDAIYWLRNVLDGSGDMQPPNERKRRKGGKSHIDDLEV